MRLLVLGAFGGGFSVKYFGVTLPEGAPVTAETFYELINKGKDDTHKTGNVIAWSEIKEKEN